MAWPPAQQVIQVHIIPQQAYLHLSLLLQTDGKAFHGFHGRGMRLPIHARAVLQTGIHMVSLHVQMADEQTANIKGLADKDFGLVKAAVVNVEGAKIVLERGHTASRVSSLHLCSHLDAAVHQVIRLLLPTQASEQNSQNSKQQLF